MRSVAERKRDARRRLSGQQLDCAVAVGILLATVAFLIFGGEMAARVVGLRHGSEGYDALNLALALAGFFLLTPLRFGIRRRIFRLCRGEALPVVEIFYPFGSAATLIRLWALKVLVRGRSTLWGMGGYAGGGVCLALLGRVDGLDRRVLAVAGVGCVVIGMALSSLARSRSFLCDYLLAQEPRASVWRLFRESDRRMRGRRAHLFALRLHFAGWFFLGLTGVTLPSLLTYYEMTVASLAADWMGETT